MGLGFIFIAAFCVGFVVFGTSQQTFEGLVAECSCCARRRQEPEVSTPPADLENAASAQTTQTTSTARSRRSMPVSTRNRIVDDQNNAIIMEEVDQRDLLKGKLVLFTLYMTIILLIIIVFTFVPVLGNRSDLGERSYTTSSLEKESWKTACERFNELELDQWGI